MSIAYLIHELKCLVHHMASLFNGQRMLATPFLYHPVEKGAIRLLCIDLSLEEPLYSILNNISPDDPSVRYTALSYTWGSARDKHELLIAGSAITISQSLNKVLQGICSHYQKLGSKHVYSWIDQICIDQQNIAEKERQVPYMSHIYKCAEMVLIWLAVPAGTLTYQVNELDEQDWLEWARTIETPLGAFIGPQRLNSSTVPTEDWRAAWRGVLAIVTNAWWERAWTYQEFMLPRKAVFLVDGHALPWQTLHKLLRWYQTLLTTNDAIEEISFPARKYLLELDWPHSHSFRCAHCEQIKGLSWLVTFVLNPANWMFVALCYWFIRMLPRELSGHAGYASFLQRTLARTDLVHLWQAVSSCDCDVTAYHHAHLLRLPAFSSWGKSEYGMRWLMSTAQDRSLWIETFLGAAPPMVFLWLKALVWDRAPIAADSMRVHWVLLNTLLHGMLMKVPIRDFNDQMQSTISGSKPRFVSWRGIRNETTISWDLVLSILKQRENGVQALPLSAVIERARNTRSSDTRDKVYAFLGVLGLSGAECPVDVKYHKSKKISAVLTQATELLILKEKSFDQLTLAIEDRASSSDSIHLPSWVPNWSRPRLQHSDHRARRDLIINDSTRHLWRASRDRRATVSFYTNMLGQRILRSQAIYIDALGARQHSIKPNLYAGQDHQGEITTLAILDNPPRTGDEVWLIIGSDMPLVLRNTALVNAFGHVLGSTVGNFMSNRQGIALGKRLSGSRTYRVICEAAVWDGLQNDYSVNQGSLIDALDAGKVVAQSIDIC